MELLKRANKLDDVIEFKLGGRSIFFPAALAGYSAFCLLAPNHYLNFFPWPWLSALSLIGCISETLRRAKWSPFYAGPTLTLTDHDIHVHGGWGRLPWSIALDDVDFAKSSSNGVFIQKNSTKPNEMLHCHMGPSSALPRIVASCINERVAAYRSKHQP